MLGDTCSLYTGKTAISHFKRSFLYGDRQTCMGTSYLLHAGTWVRPTTVPGTLLC